jgi:hypothetical protein
MKAEMQLLDELTEELGTRPAACLLEQAYIICCFFERIGYRLL